MPFCRECGTEAEAYHRYCRNCGAEIGTGATEIGALGPVAQEAAPVLNYYVSPKRILLMSVLSYGLYLLYWFYLTWKHYRDYNNGDAFPIWHALTLFVPFYNLFRTHAHMRTYKELMDSAGVPSTISPGWAVALVAISLVLGNVAFRITGGIDFSQEVSAQAAWSAALLDVVSVGIVAGLLLHVQGNLNRYWSTVNNSWVESATIGVGEVIIALIGLLLWVSILSLLLSPAARSGF